MRPPLPAGDHDFFLFSDILEDGIRIRRQHHTMSSTAMLNATSSRVNSLAILLGNVQAKIALLEQTVNSILGHGSTDDIEARLLSLETMMQDLYAKRTDVEAGLQTVIKVQSDVVKDMSSIRTSFVGGIDQLRATVDADISSVRQSLANDVMEIKDMITVAVASLKQQKTQREDDDDESNFA